MSCLFLHLCFTLKSLVSCLQLYNHCVESLVTFVLQGQYKSTLVCPVCNKVSITFDPFMYLSLPLQSTTTRSMTVTVFTCDGSALPAAYTITVPKQGRCRDLIQALSNACSLQLNEKLLLAEVGRLNCWWSHRIYVHGLVTEYLFLCCHR